MVCCDCSLSMNGFLCVKYPLSPMTLRFWLLYSVLYVCFFCIGDLGLGLEVKLSFKFFAKWLSKSYS
jgi:hypothetical protein